MEPSPRNPALKHRATNRRITPPGQGICGIWAVGLCAGPFLRSFSAQDPYLSAVHRACEGGAAGRTSFTSEERWACYPAISSMRLSDFSAPDATSGGTVI